MSFASDDLGVLGNLAKALGVFTPEGEPNPGWFGNPEASLKTMLANQAQREALIAFVDDAMGGADRTTDPRGVVWLPIVHLDDPDLTIAVTVDESQPDGLHIGIGIAVHTTNPASTSSLAVPLFRTKKGNGPNVTPAQALLLGSAGGRIRLATSITVDAAAPVPGQARLGAIGIDIDLPTAPNDPVAPVFGLSLTGFQLPGATGPRDLRVAADGLDELDDALLDLVLALVKAQADSAAAGSVIAAVGGLLGLKSGDAIPDFPITALPTQGVQAIAAWLHGLITTPASRSVWMGYLATLLGGEPQDDAVAFQLGGAPGPTINLTLGLRVDTGPSGNTRLTPSLGIDLGDATKRVEARADLFEVDLVTGAAKALPQFGLWAAAGRPVNGQRVLDVAGPPVARADTLRIGFALDGDRHLNFVLAADGVVLGAHTYPTLDLTSPDAVMDAVGNTVGDVATQLLGNLGGALPAVRLLIGLDAPAGVAAVTLPALMADPLAAIAGYWRALVAAAGNAAATVLAELRNALADAGSAASAILGTGIALDPWRVPLVGPLALEFHADGPVLTIGLAVVTSVDTLGQRCTVIETRIAATLAEIDLQARSASLLPGVEGVLSARERGINPPRVTLALGSGTALTARGVGLRLGWTPAGGLAASVSAPDLHLATGDLSVPIALPAIAADGSVTLAPAAWDGVEALVGYLGELLGGFFGDTVAALGWTTELPSTAGIADSGARLRLADLVGDPAQALRGWLPRLALSDAGPEALALLADLFAGAGPNRGFIEGSGHPDDPYRLALADGLPNLAVWFPPAGLEPRLTRAPEPLRNWRPGDPGLSPAALAAALADEARVAADVRELVEARDVAAGLAALAQRWVGGDGRIVAPATPPTGVTIDLTGFAAGQLFGQLDLEDLTGRIPTTTVYVALGSTAWPDAPAGRRIDLGTPRLDAAMFAAPAAAVGDWFVALGSRADCLATGSTTDGTPEQAARLARVLDALAGVSNDIALVALDGAGHAARLAAQAQAAVTDLVTLGTPLAPIALTAITTQPTADALRLLHRLLPPAPTADDEPDDEDLALGRGLVGAMMELVDRADPAAELRPPAVAPVPPRAGLAVTAVFGAVPASRIARALTAIVAAGLAQRARTRAATPLPEPTGVQAGLRLVLAPTTSGALSFSGSALLTLFSFDKTTAGIDTTRQLRVQLRVGDRLGWLSATPELELRCVTADIALPLDGSSTGTATVTLHDARVFGQSWERLVLGTGPGAVPLLPEARVLLATAVQRIGADAAGIASLALDSLLSALGLTSPTGGLAGDALDQLLHDPGGLLRQRMAVAGAELSEAVAVLLGPLGSSVDLVARSVRVQGGGNASGRFGWHADVTASPAGLGGELRFGADTPTQPAGALNLVLALQPLQVSLQWHQSGGATDIVALWPNPDAQAIARAVARSAPSLGGHAALELMRQADEAARPVIDAALDAFGLLAGAAGDAQRAIRPLAGLLADPAGWLRSAGSLGANPARIQALFDALRPLLGVAGAAGSPLVLGSGITFSVAPAAAGARLALDVDPGAWAPPAGVAARLAAGLGASLTLGSAGPPTLGLQLHVGLTGAASGRQAVHARLGTGGIEVFVRPASGADIPLVPFAGLGSLAAAAEAALPFLLDQLAGINGTVGQLVGTVGDALALRSGAPKKFDAVALHDWALDPTGQLVLALPSIASTGLTTIAPLLDSFMPADVAATANANTLTVAIGGFALAWSPASGAVALSGNDIVVPGIEHISFTLALAATGIEELSVTAGPAQIDAGGVELRPFVTVAAGNGLVGGSRVAIGMAVDDTHRFAIRWLLDAHQFALVASDGPVVSGLDSVDPVKVALRIVEVVADLVAGVAMAQPAVTQLLDTAVGATNVRNMMRGVVLRDQANPTQLVNGMFDPTTLLTRIHRLFGNIAGAGIAITVDGFTVSFTKSGGTIGLQAGLAKRFPLVSGNVMLWLENDDAWIENNPPGNGGLFVGFLPDTLPLRFTPSLTVNGVGLRIGKNSGPLLDAGITLESIALHAFAKIDGGGARSGGVQLQFSNLAVSAGGAKGDNGIAQGIMRDTGPKPPQPAFSPALAIQKHDNQPVHVTLRAGDGDGPWWIAIQKGFGPLYLEQIGFGATMPAGRVERVSLLMDGSVSMFGLTCAVDDLQITYLTTNGDFFNPNNWAVDLAGLAVSANMAGVSIAGGLLKQQTPVGIEYLGMLLGRFGVYGITIYGGYGEGTVAGQKFTAFFAVGAVNGPIGGPPAFFLTGIGGGFGINRKLVVPTDLSRFGDYPLIQALDIAAQPQDPMTQLRKLGDYFPMEKGTFWFAAGLSFNSFALVDGIAVVAVEIGDGLDINLLGLARMALPRPQVALVSIELALMVRFSSSEGVLWVQGQLTDNSWLLYPDIKLTGGFAYVIWFKGEHKGEFVLTLGGYHPDFHRDGYPQVPRLGMRWSVSDNIVIKSGSYFALTSEALMAGGDFEASASFGPAWAEVKFGANGIVYFDPFHYDVDAYARIAAGVTIDTWIFGEVTISISIGARIEVTGPDFHGKATFEVGPIELTVEFGGSDQAQKQPLSAPAFIDKYLEAGDGGALAHALMTSFGALPAKGEDSTPDGSAARPFVVVVEFGMTFTTTVPATSVTRVQAAAGATTPHAASRALGVAPMDAQNLQPVIQLTWKRAGATQPFPFVATARPFGSFPVGIWGPPQDADNRKVPKAEMIEALNELDLVSRATPSGGGPEIPYYQVVAGKRKPLPFSRRSVDVNLLKSQAQAVAGLITAPATVAAAFQQARTFLAATPTAMASLRGERQAPPLLGTLAEGLQSDPATVAPAVGATPAAKVYDHFVDAPVAVGFMSGATVDLRVASAARTTVKGSAKAWRVAPPSFASVEAERSRSIAARLVLAEPQAVRTDKVKTVIGAVGVPVTAIGHAAPAVVARSGASTALLGDFTAALAAGPRSARAATGQPGASLLPGQTVVLKLPNAKADAALGGARPSLGVSGAPARVVLLGLGGKLLADAMVGPDVTGKQGSIEIPAGTERIVAIGQSTQAGAAIDAGLAGWHAGMQLPYAGWSSAVAPGCVVRSNGDTLALHRERLDAGWVGGAELARGVSTVSTTFTQAPRSVVIVLDDPAAFGDAAGARQLLMGLDGAERRQDAAGEALAPVLLAMENRSVLAYDIVPDGSGPVVVTIASEAGWSLVGVMGSSQLDATGAIAAISARGLDAALRPFAAAPAKDAPASRLAWLGPVRSSTERHQARALASGRPLAAVGTNPPSRRKKGGHR
ncbi:hypothetical protein QTH89_26070 [Variovorax sp. J22G21]|uniref:DUF6603 domain-containing protein n=1 Tax=Variovorax fucosicus TaxID=3053517 RepID=UPI002575861F|nr:MULTISPECIES: DUF6603 domain-containing protein [unclassified Variovorax]MDM0042714.1 hypothetical protein [Variovorax sp. J22R193]MDM0064708.1 hypothetical protein [Variovorax sp. J22G21]